MTGPAIAKVQAKPYDDPGASWVDIDTFVDGRVSKDIRQLSRRFEFKTRQARTLYATDYGSFADWILQRGAYVRVICTPDGSFSGGNEKTEFEGRVFTTTPALAGSGPQDISYVCYDRLKAAGHCGVNLAAATRQKIVEVTATGADFQDQFTLNIPLDSDTEGLDYVPGQLLYISTGSYENDDGDVVLRDYGPEEYVYLSGYSQVVFQESQQERIDAGATWYIKRLYYDPTDTTWSVKNTLIAILTGDSFSYDGGHDFAAGDLSLEEIVSFNGVDPKLIRYLPHDKADAPTSQLLDRMRDEGLLPVNYWLRYDPATSKVKGEYIYQGGSDTINLNSPKIWVTHTSPMTLEGVVGIVENYTDGVFPQNYMMQATVQLTTDSTFLATYDVVGEAANINDGDGATFIQFQRAGAALTDEPRGGPDDLLVADLCPNAGDPSYRDVRRITFRGSAPKEVDGSDFIEIPVYHKRNEARVTIVGSLNPITESNPGNPVSSQAINETVPLNEIAGTFDLDVDCDLMRHVRYLGIRMEQEALFRRNQKKLFNNPKRVGYLGVSELGAYGNEWLRYDDDDPDAGRVPFAALTNLATTVTAVTDTTHFNVDDTGGIASSWIAVDTYIQVLVAGSPILTKVTAVNDIGSELELTVETAVTGVGVNDDVGYRKRWMEGVSGVLYDFYLPKLFAKLDGIMQQEQLTSGEAGNVAEAEALAADRLWELISITRDHEVEHLYDPDVDIGATVQGDLASEEFLCTRQEVIITAGRVGEYPNVTQNTQGTCYEETPQ